MMDRREKIKNLTSDQLSSLLQRSKKVVPTNEIPKRTENFFPLSHSQKRIWFQSALENGTSLYNVPLALTIKTKSTLKIEQLTEAVNSIIDRNEILRTVFQFQNGAPVQFVKPALRINVAYEDLQSLPISMRMKKGIELATLDAKKPFDIEHGPLIRFSVFQIDYSEYIFLLTTHHLVSDGWSNNLFFLELSKAPIFSKQNEIARNQYVEFVAWEKERLQKNDLDKALSFWKEYLDGELPITKFPQEYVGKQEKSLKSTQAVFSMKSSQKIKDFSKANGVTLFVTLLSAFNVLLFRYTEKEDLLIGFPHANRQTPEFQRTFGLFINLIPFRSKINKNGTFLDYLQEVNQSIKKVFAHGEIPFNFLVEHLNPHRNLGIEPLFQILFVHQNFPEAYKHPEAKIVPIPIDVGEGHYNLTFIVEDFNDEINVKIKYKNDLYDPFYIDKIFEHYANVLEAAVKNPTELISHICLISKEEKEWLLAKARHKAYSEENSILFCEAFQSQVKQTPDAIALECQDRSLTYLDLNKKANQLARSLPASSETLIAVLLDRTESFLIAFIGILKSGAAFLPIDPAFPKERIHHLLESSKAAFLISESRFQSLVASSHIPYLFLDTDLDSLQKESDKDLDLNINDRDLAYVIFTSGSTGNPKGVCIEHGQLASYIQSIDLETSCFNLNRFAFTSTIAADLGYTNLFFPLTKGGTVIIIPKDVTDDPDRLSLFLERNSVDCLKFAPSQFSFLLKAQVPFHILPKKLLILAGEVTPYSLISEVKKLNSDCKLIINYGPTETTISAMTNQAVYENPWKTNPFLGHPNLNYHIYLMDERMGLVPIGVEGEIYIGGKSVARGYLNQPQLTADSFLMNPFSKESRLYKTGDRARYTKDGEIEFLGRKDRQVKIRGFRVELGEIEAALNKIPGVDQAAVVYQSGTLVAFVVLKVGDSVSGEKIKRTLRDWLPSYMVPLEVSILPEFSLTPSGKIDFKSLKQHIPYSEKTITQFARDSVELTLTKIWEEVLKVDRLGVNESFFDLGGHSFLALDLILKIEDAFGVKLSLAILFESNTIEQLAEKIRNEAVSLYRTPLVVIQKGKELPAFFFVHPAGGQVLCYYDLAKSLKRDVPFYGLHAPFMEEEGLHHHDSIEKIASKYLVDVRKILPQMGPVVFGGWSLGGVIAFEMARHISVETGRFPFVVILDQGVSSLSGEEMSFLPDSEYIMKLLKQVETFNEVDFGMKIDQFKGKSFEEQSHLVYHTFIEKRLIPEDVQKENFLKFLEMQKIQSTALNKYKPGKYAGPVLLIRAEASQSQKNNVPSLFWDKVASDLTIQWVPGTHTSMMKLPHVNTTSQIINTWMDTRNILV